jgi:tripartite-type tricarboxylate transporter receptor subunit TctC
MPPTPTRAALAALAAGVVLSLTAHAQQKPWPTKPVRVILPNAPGSAPDITIRLFGDQMANAVGQPWVVENRPGGEGIPGTEAVIRAAPDGYTFGLTSSNVVTLNPLLIRPLSYDPLKDMLYIAMVIDTAPLGVAVAPDLPVASLRDLVELAKSRPGGVSYSTTVPIAGLAGDWLNKTTGTNLVQVSYKAVSQALQDGLAGRVPVLINSIGPLEPQVRAGKLRFIAMTSAKRQAAWPDVPTIRETYADGFVSDGWLPLFGPIGVPAEIVQRVNRESERIVRSREFLDPLRTHGWSNINGASTPAGILAHTKEELDRWGKIIRDIAPSK